MHSSRKLKRIDNGPRITLERDRGQDLDLRFFKKDFKPTESQLLILEFGFYVFLLLALVLAMAFIK
jgi:hypothetical protein